MDSEIDYNCPLRCMAVNYKNIAKKPISEHFYIYIAASYVLRINIIHRPGND